MPTDKGTIARIQAQIDAGELAIITSEHACGGGKHPKLPPFDVEVCAAFEHPVECPKHWVINPAVRLEGPLPKGIYRVYSEGDVDYCQGQPVPLLQRLQAHKWMVVQRAATGKCKTCQAEMRADPEAVAGEA